MPGFTRCFHQTSFLSTLTVSLCDIITSHFTNEETQNGLRMGTICSRFRNHCVADLGLDFILPGSKTVFCILLALIGSTWRLVYGLNEIQAHLCPEFPLPMDCGSPRS